MRRQNLETVEDRPLPGRHRAAVVAALAKGADDSVRRAGEEAEGIRQEFLGTARTLLPGSQG